MEGRVVRLDLTRQVAAERREQPLTAPLVPLAQTQPGANFVARAAVEVPATPLAPVARVEREASPVAAVALVPEASRPEARAASAATESAGWSQSSSHANQPDPQAVG